jgi:hypothetical protein
LPCAIDVWLFMILSLAVIVTILTFASFGTLVPVAKLNMISLPGLVRFINETDIAIGVACPVGAPALNIFAVNV